ncbi:MAG: hypothetical protein ACJA1Q_000779 [Pseudohongiellaceae bacterium]|jgi:hypothetical protein
MHLPVPQNHRGSTSMTGIPLQLPHDISRRDFMRLWAAIAAAEILLLCTKPIAAQSMTLS